jgi:hypothetical protein
MENPLYPGEIEAAIFGVRVIAMHQNRDEAERGDWQQA